MLCAPNIGVTAQGVASLRRFLSYARNGGNFPLPSPINHYFKLTHNSLQCPGSQESQEVQEVAASFFPVPDLDCREEGRFMDSYIFIAWNESLN